MTWNFDRHNWNLGTLEVTKKCQERCEASYSQAGSSISPKIPLMNNLIEK